MQKLEAIKILETKLAAIEQEHRQITKSPGEAACLPGLLCSLPIVEGDASTPKRLFFPLRAAFKAS
jgi:hypothetical protein